MNDTNHFVAVNCLIVGCHYSVGADGKGREHLAGDNSKQQPNHGETVAIWG